LILDKNSYRLSSVGKCPLELAAPKLGYDCDPDPQWLTDIGEYATFLEDYVADKLSKKLTLHGIRHTLIHPELCQACLERFGDERHGHHCELDTGVALMPGHKDLLIELPDYYDRPVVGEVKTMSAFIYPTFLKRGFPYKSTYGPQIECYMEHEQTPAVYIAFNR